MLYGGALALASIPLAAVAFVAPVAFASFVALIRGHDSHYLLIAVVSAFTLGCCSEAYSFPPNSYERASWRNSHRTDSEPAHAEIAGERFERDGGTVTGLAHELNAAPHGERRLSR